MYYVSLNDFADINENWSFRAALDQKSSSILTGPRSVKPKCHTISVPSFCPSVDNWMKNDRGIFAWQNMFFFAIEKDASKRVAGNGTIK